MAPFYGWSSTASRLAEPLRGGSLGRDKLLYKKTVSFPKVFKE